MTATPSTGPGAFVVALVTSALVLESCGRSELTGPPTMRLGRDECAACGMLVNEERCSSALLLERDRERLFAFFDDLGCMMNYEYDHAHDVRVLERYARDYQTRAWLNTDHAVFVRADREKLQTPMGSGTIALANAEAAAHLGITWQAGPMAYRDAFRDRREWMWANYGKPDNARPAELP